MLSDMPSTVAQAPGPWRVGRRAALQRFRAAGRCGRGSASRPRAISRDSKRSAGSSAHSGQVQMQSDFHRRNCPGHAVRVPLAPGNRPHHGREPPALCPASRQRASTGLVHAVVQTIVVHAQCDGTPAAAMLRRLMHRIDRRHRFTHSSFPVRSASARAARPGSSSWARRCLLCTGASHRSRKRWAGWHRCRPTWRAGWWHSPSRSAATIS